MKPTLVKWVGALALALTASAGWGDFASAQQAPVRVRGTIEKVDGATLTVKARDGATHIIKLADNVRVLGLVSIAVGDVKAGDYVGVSALPQPDGSQRALHVHVFLDAMRGVAEGHRPWDVQPTSTMTNATVAEVAAAPSGQTLMVKYKDGEKKIVVAPGTPVVRYVPGDRSELKPGAHIFIIAAMKQPDGTLSAAGVTVGRNGLVPPM
jgi:hypothetical protein